MFQWNIVQDHTEFLLSNHMSWTDQVLRDAVSKMNLQEGNLPLLAFSPRVVSPFIYVNSHDIAEVSGFSLSEAEMVFDRNTFWLNDAFPKLSISKIENVINYLWLQPKDQQQLLSFLQATSRNIWTVETNAHSYHHMLNVCMEKKDRRVQYGWNQDLKSVILDWSSKPKCFTGLVATELFLSNDSKTFAHLSVNHFLLVFLSLAITSKLSSDMFQDILLPKSEILSLEPAASLASFKENCQVRAITFIGSFMVILCGHSLFNNHVSGRPSLRHPNPGHHRGIWKLLWAEAGEQFTLLI